MNEDGQDPGSWEPLPAGARRAAEGGGPRRGLIPLRPMTVGDVLDGAFKLLRATFATVALIVLVAFVPFEALRQLLLGPLLGLSDPQMLPFLTPEGAPAPDAAIDPALLAQVLAVGVVAGLLSWLVTILVSGAVTWAVARHEDGQDVVWRDAYGASLGRYGALLGASLLLFLVGIAGLVAIGVVAGVLGAAVHVALAVVVALVALVLLGLVLLPVSYVNVPVIVLEQRGPLEGLRRSWGLLRPRLGAVFGIVLLAGLIVAVVGGIVGALVGLLAGGLSLVAEPLAWIVTGAGNVLAQLVVLPLVANVALLVYLDARVRHEGLDIELATGPPPPT